MYVCQNNFYFNTTNDISAGLIFNQVCLWQHCAKFVFQNSGVVLSSGQIVAYAHSSIGRLLVPVWRPQCRLQTYEWEYLSTLYYHFPCGFDHLMVFYWFPLHFLDQVMGGCLMSKQRNGEKLSILLRINQGSNNHKLQVLHLIVHTGVCRIYMASLHSLLRLWHTACPGKDSDVIVFGGSCDYILLVDTVSVAETL